jgi:hypothetical protein
MPVHHIYKWYSYLANIQDDNLMREYYYDMVDWYTLLIYISYKGASHA